MELKVTIRTILDTDIGTDVDDCIALAFILGSPEIALEGVTCVYGDVRLRARMVQKLLRLAGRSEVPVFLGAEPPLLGLRPVYWPGHEGVGLLDDAEDLPSPQAEHAVDFIVRTVMDNPGQIHLLAIGPLTNVALAFRREPRLASNLQHLTIMGGVVREPSRLGLPIVEHNMACDPEAAHIVFAAGAPTTVVPLDVTTRVLVRRADMEAIRSGGTPFHDAVARQIELYPRFADNGATPLHDPLAAAVMVRPDLVELIPARVEIETQGRLTSGMTLLRKPDPEAGGDTRVAIAVDVSAAERFVRDRLAGVVVR
jgi:purine nucleosidase